MNKTYDVIVVGARCAGAPMAMLLARAGQRVLLVDRATFPSDTVSTHVIHPVGVAALARWGLLDRLIATGCPPIDTYAFDFGPFTITGSPGTAQSPVAYCPRRTILDQLLVDAAGEAGAEVRTGFVVDEVLTENGRVTGIRGRTADGREVTEHAEVVVGADGRNSQIARTVQPEAYNERPALLVAYYSYWSGLPMNGRFETYIRPNRGFAAVPTHDDLTLVIAGWPHAEFEANKRDLDGNYLGVMALAPSFFERLRGAKRETKITGAVVSGFFRKPFGPGWLLVGDSGYTKDPITAQGITDAFLDAERSADALGQALRGGRPFDEVMSETHRNRDARALPMYGFTCELASLAPPPPETQQLFAAVHGNQASMDRFVQMNAGTISPADFFAPDSLAEIMAGRRSG